MLDMFSEWIKERVSGGHVMRAGARSTAALGLTLNICMARPGDITLHSALGQQEGLLLRQKEGRTDRGCSAGQR